MPARQGRPDISLKKKGASPQLGRDSRNGPSRYAVAAKSPDQKSLPLDLIMKKPASKCVHSFLKLFAAICGSHITASAHKSNVRNRLATQFFLILSCLKQAKEEAYGAKASGPGSAFQQTAEPFTLKLAGCYRRYEHLLRGEAFVASAFSLLDCR